MGGREGVREIRIEREWVGGREGVREIRIEREWVGDLTTDRVNYMYIISGNLVLKINTIQVHYVQVEICMESQAIECTCTRRK